MMHLDSITVSINGVEYKVNTKDVRPETSLNAYLREKLHLTGTKNMCLEGGCGTCTVAIEENVDGKNKFYSLNSCLVSILSCDGWKIHTVEGIGNPLIGFHQIQKVLSDNYGTQCGFCSPGMVMNMYALQESGSNSKDEIEDSFGGNICRCTGYRPILHAFKQLSDENGILDIEDIKVCPTTGRTCTKSYNINKAAVLKSGDVTWIKVASLNELLLTLKNSTATNYILVSGNTGKGVYKDAAKPDLYIDIQDVAELVSYSIDDKTLKLGANINLTQLINICKENSTLDKFSFLDTIKNHLHLVASVQVRNVGSIAGNLMLKYKHNEFQSDIFLLLETFNATLVIVDVNGNKTYTTPQEFLKLDMKNKVIKKIILNSLDTSYIFSTYKIMPRAQNAHAIVNAGFLFQLDNNIVQSARIVYGGISPSFIHSKNTETLLMGKYLYDNATLHSCFDSLNKELDPDHVLPDPSPIYRKNLAISLFYKFVLKTCPEDLVANRYKSGGTLLARPLSSGIQEFKTNKAEWPLTQPIPKLESLAQCSGQAEYIMDIPKRPNEVYCTFVTAKAGAGSTILEIDTSKALAVDGVLAYYDKRDIPGINNFTPTNVSIFSVEEELFCTGTVQYYHQPIGIIVATTQFVAHKAADLISVKYGAPKTRSYLNVKDVLANNVTDRISLCSTFKPTRKGHDVKQVITGEFYIGSQYHYHMEVQCCKVVPTDDGIDIYPASQWLDVNQLAAAAVLNIPSNKINVKVRRLGGGFGGKMIRSGLVSTATALAALKLQRSVTMIMSFEQNMEIIGKRYPLYMKYAVGVNNTGVIQYLDAKLYSDFGVGGNEPIDDMLVASFKNCYNPETFGFSTYSVKTDKSPNCYTRAPDADPHVPTLGQHLLVKDTKRCKLKPNILIVLGTVEATAAIESILDHISYTLNLDPMNVRLANITTPTIPKYWTDLQTWADIAKRSQEIQTFNKENRWKKQGISVVPMKWILEVAANYSVLVSIFHGDGGVAISHGGVEIGQGINTKVAQVCAYKFGITLNKVSIKPSYNFITANSTATGGSLTSEAICYALIKACDTLLDRMKPIKEHMTNPTWEEIVKKCFESNVQLIATGFYYGGAPNIQQYPIYGICSSTVEVDLLTGKHEILQVDIIEDLGESMSPLIDIGQIEGAFVMGIGYYLTEEIIYDADGKLLTNRTWNYKPPGAKDIPINFRVKFAENSLNPVGVLKSKAVAEPPICLSIAVPLAIRNALADAREEADSTQTKWIPIDGPTTVEETFLNSLNDYKQYVLK